MVETKILIPLLPLTRSIPVFPSIVFQPRLYLSAQFRLALLNVVAVYFFGQWILSA